MAAVRAHLRFGSAIALGASQYVQGYELDASLKDEDEILQADRPVSHEALPLPVNGCGIVLQRRLPHVILLQA